MTAIQMLTHSHIRKVNVRQDLLAVADLIEVCFSSTLDEDGRDYLRHLRWAARDFNYLSWLQGAAKRIAAPLYGFVWEENGRIVGNLSLIPFVRRGHFVYLIANVAVHPDYRRNGIAHQLTQTALDYVRRRGVSSVWLQVRDDNPVAYHLYLSLGFIEPSPPHHLAEQRQRHDPIKLASLEGISIHHRRMQDWNQQLARLREIYPPDVAWNLPLSFSRLSPNLVNQFSRWLQGESQEHWTAYYADKMVGALSWEPMRSSTDSLWLAAWGEHEEAAVQSLLTHARFSLSGRSRPMAVNYPAGRSAEAFLRSGFSNHQTLIWMSANLNQE